MLENCFYVNHDIVVSWKESVNSLLLLQEQKDLLFLLFLLLLKSYKKSVFKGKEHREGAGKESI